MDSVVDGEVTVAPGGDSPEDLPPDPDEAEPPTDPSLIAVPVLAHALQDQKEPQPPGFEVPQTVAMAPMEGGSMSFDHATPARLASSAVPETRAMPAQPSMSTDAPLGPTYPEEAADTLPPDAPSAAGVRDSAAIGAPAPRKRKRKRKRPAGGARSGGANRRASSGGKGGGRRKSGVAALQPPPSAGPSKGMILFVVVGLTLLAIGIVLVALN